MAKGTNPKNIPASKADVKKAKEEGKLLGMELALNIVLYVLKDKHEAPTSEIMQLRDEFMYVVDSIAKRYLKYSDIKKTLSGEYDLSVQLIDTKKGA